MADYRELLRRAVYALPENNGMSRRAVYEKAREALVTQLRAIEPALPAREITQHRLTLEDCIRQVEQEATEALLQGLKQETEAPIVPPAEPKPAVDMSDAKPTRTEPEKPIVYVPEVAQEPLAKPSDHPEAPTGDGGDQPSDIVQVDETQADETETKSFAQSAPDEPISDTKIVETNDDATEKGSVDEKSPAINATAAIDETPLDNTAIVGEVLAQEPEPAPKNEEPETAEVLPPVVVHTQPVPNTPKKEISDDEDKGASAPEPKNPVDQVIAAAHAASSASAINPPKVVIRSDTQRSHSVDAAPTITPALSSVREVEVDESLSVSAIDVGGDEPQATIDRAIKALDMEAEGKEAEGKKAEGKDAEEHFAANAGAKAVDHNKGAGTGSSAAQLLDDLSETQIVEDEETGGNGLTVFLLLVVVLLASAGGGAYWAWKEGFVDLNPLMAQLGLSDKTTSEGQANPVAVTPTPDSTATQSNVRDILPSASPGLAEMTSETAPVVEDTAPLETAEDVKLTPETVESATAPTPATSEIAVGEEPATPSDERLTAAEMVGDADQPELNVGGTGETAGEVGSRSLLIEEQITGTGGAVPFSGETQWSRDVDELGSPVIKALVSVPARNLTVNVLIRKNSDPALPASHLVEVNFSVTESFLGGGIASLPGILLKDQELAQGDPLVGASARIFDNSFLFALSAAEADLAKNVALISERGWIDLPVVYSTGRKAIVTLEKGKAGGAIFEAVLAAWAVE